MKQNLTNAIDVIMMQSQSKIKAAITLNEEFSYQPTNLMNVLRLRRAAMTLTELVTREVKRKLIREKVSSCV